MAKVEPTATLEWTAHVLCVFFRRLPPVFDTNPALVLSLLTMITVAMFLAIEVLANPPVGAKLAVNAACKIVAHANSTVDETYKWESLKKAYRRWTKRMNNATSHMSNAAKATDAGRKKAEAAVDARAALGPFEQDRVIGILQALADGNFSVEAQDLYNLIRMSSSRPIADIYGVTARLLDAAGLKFKNCKIISAARADASEERRHQAVLWLDAFFKELEMRSQAAGTGGNASATSAKTIVYFDEILICCKSNGKNEMRVEFRRRSRQQVKGTKNGAACGSIVSLMGVGGAIYTAMILKPTTSTTTATKPADEDGFVVVTAKILPPHDPRMVCLRGPTKFDSVYYTTTGLLNTACWKHMSAEMGDALLADAPGVQRIMMCDQLGVHKDIESMMALHARGITMFMLFESTTSFWSVADDRWFGEYQKALNKIVRQKRYGLGTLSNIPWPQLLAQAAAKAIAATFTPAIAASSFGRVGIYPPDRKKMQKLYDENVGVDSSSSTSSIALVLPPGTIVSPVAVAAAVDVLSGGAAKRTQNALLAIIREHENITPAQKKQIDLSQQGLAVQLNRPYKAQDLYDAAMTKAAETAADEAKKEANKMKRCCSNCGEPGHNKTKCLAPPGQPKKKKKKKVVAPEAVAPEDAPKTTPGNDDEDELEHEDGMGDTDDDDSYSVHNDSDCDDGHMSTEDEDEDETSAYEEPKRKAAMKCAAPPKKAAQATAAVPAEKVSLTKQFATAVGGSGPVPRVRRPPQWLDE